MAAEPLSAGILPPEFLLNIQKTHTARKLFIGTGKLKIREKLYLLVLLFDTDALSERPLGVWRAHLSGRDRNSKGDDL